MLGSRRALQLKIVVLHGPVLETKNFLILPRRDNPPEEAFSLRKGSVNDFKSTWLPLIGLPYDPRRVGPTGLKMKEMPMGP